MDRLGWRYLQLVQETDLALADAQSETADRALYSDQCSASAPGGILSGLAVAQSSVPALTVVVDLGTAYDQTGQRMRVPSPQTVNVAADHLGATTLVTSSGNSKIISVFIRFARNAYTPVPDGNSISVFWRNDESFELYVTQGAEGPTPAAPALIADGILLCDITRAYGQTTIVTGNLSTTRRQWQYGIAGTPRAIARGTAYDGLKDLLGYYDNHVLGIADKHAAGDLVLAVAATWANGNTIAATDVDGGFEEVVGELASILPSGSGADHVGCFSIIGSVNTIAAGTVFQTLTALKSAANLEYAGGPPWANSAANNIGSIEATIDGIFTDLAATALSGRESGGAKIGMPTLGNFAGGSVKAYFAELVAVTTNNDGMKRVGAEVKGSFLTNTGRGQLDELDVGWGKLARANSWAGAQSFADITASGATHYKLASRSVTRMQKGMYSDPVAVGGQDGIFFVIPHGAVLTSVNVYFTPGTHSAWPPTVKSIAVLTKINQTTGTTSINSTTFDTASTLGASNAVRSILISAINDTMDRTTIVYFVQFTNETGPNAQACSMLGVSVTYTTTYVDDGY